MSKKITDPFYLKIGTPVLVNALAYLISYFIYDFSLNSREFILINITLLIILSLFMIVLSNYLPCLSFTEKQFPFSKTLVLVIIGSNLIEYSCMGVPFLGNIIYANFGLPLLHHVSVSSWLLIFLAPSFKNKMIVGALIIFALINPLLMLNRDVLLLTFFTISTYLWYKGLIKIIHIILLTFLVVFLFGLLGEYRSPNGLNSLTLPFTFNIDNLNFTSLWLLLYTTSSSFNMYSNFDQTTLNLVNQFANVFPEPYRWVAYSGSPYCFLFFFLIVSFLLLVFRVLASLSAIGYWFLFFLYIIYQTFMALFGVKFFTTNTVFVFLLFVLISIFSVISKKRILHA